MARAALRGRAARYRLQIRGTRQGSRTAAPIHDIPPTTDTCAASDNARRGLCTPSTLSTLTLTSTLKKTPTLAPRLCTLLREFFLNSLSAMSAKPPFSPLLGGVPAGGRGLGGGWRGSPSQFFSILFSSASMRSINSIGTFWYIMIDMFKYKIDMFVSRRIRLIGYAVPFSIFSFSQLISRIKQIILSHAIFFSHRERREHRGALASLVLAIRRVCRSLLADYCLTQISRNVFAARRG